MDLDRDLPVTFAPGHTEASGTSPVTVPRAGDQDGRRSQHLEATRRRREERRVVASPYDPRHRGGSGARDKAQRQGPTAGETQVLMSLWGL